VNTSHGLLVEPQLIVETCSKTVATRVPKIVAALIYMTRPAWASAMRFRTTIGVTIPCRLLVWSAYPPTRCPETVAYSYRWCDVFGLNMGSPWVAVDRSTLNLQPTHADATIQLMRLFGGAITLPFSIGGFCDFWWRRSGCLLIVAGPDRLFVGGDSDRLSRCLYPLFWVATVVDADYLTMKQSSLSMSRSVMNEMIDETINIGRRSGEQNL